jgi:hypothetical protein
MPLTRKTPLRIARAAALAATLCGLLASPARAEETDEAELSKYYANVDVWHFPVDYSVAYNDQDVIVTRDLVALPPPAGKLCFIRFDLLKGEGDYAYGFKPAFLEGPRRETEWGVYVHKRGSVFNQLRSALKLNVIYFYVDGLRDEFKASPPDICARAQAADTARAGNGYWAREWSDLVVHAKLIHGWPTGPEAR